RTAGSHLGSAPLQPIGEQQHVNIGDAMFARDREMRECRPPNNVLFYFP
ncbi:hypothetical protein ABIA85_010036, partial [Bradyrhizobium sp. LA6.10]